MIGGVGVRLHLDEGPRDSRSGRWRHWGSLHLTAVWAAVRAGCCAVIVRPCLPAIGLGCACRDARGHFASMLELASCSPTADTGPAAGASVRESIAKGGRRLGLLSCGCAVLE